MKNMKVSLKLIVSFLIVTALTALIGVIGIVGMLQASNSTKSIYYDQFTPFEELTYAQDYLQRARVNVREMVIAQIEGDTPRVSQSKGRIDYYVPEIQKRMDSFAVSIGDPNIKSQFDKSRDIFNTQLVPVVIDIYNALQADDMDTVYRKLAECVALSTQIEAGFDASKDYKDHNAADAYNDAEKNANLLLIVIIIVLLVVIVVSMALAFYISGIISKPLKVLDGFMSRAGSTGDITMSSAENAAITEYSQYTDEIGSCVKGSKSFIDHVTDVARELEVVSKGDLSLEIDVISDRDVLGNSLKTMVDNLGSAFGEINNSTSQVSDGSKQIADGSQSLAQGSTQQAAAVEELSSSISEIAQKTKENSEKAVKAANLANTIKLSAEKGSGQMDEMMAAVKEINTASQSISKVIKAIDDIAFQTNILALNAAVEAARAGQHGKGFAVVAEEVRNLASKSAEAAKETGVMIQNSVEKAALGSRIAEDTAASLAEIVNGINESTQLVTEIATSSEEQTLGITQINRGIDQVAQVVQENSATAEQSAAASEEMSGQANMLQELIAQFKLKDGNNFRKLSAPSGGGNRKIAMPEKNSYVPTGGGDYGKY
jgi:methyl-accepting chemotaxis protein